MTVQTLATAIQDIAQTDGPHTTALPSLSVFRSSAPTAPMACLYGLGLAITAQGSKRVSYGDQVFQYTPGKSLLTAVDLPVVAQITEASPTEPFLGLLLTLDAKSLMQLCGEMALPAVTRVSEPRAVSMCELDPPLLDAVIRLLSLLKEPTLLPHVAPLIQQEIMVRLLNGPHGLALRHLLAAGSPSHQVARAMAWLRQHFRDHVLMDDLAATVHMSPSTFRQHFRQLTGLSPLQYQKQLRLQEARHLMLNQGIDALSTATRVGYESASQFSRDYRRVFGEPPRRDVNRMRGVATSD